MKIFKKIFAALVLALLVITLSACGENNAKKITGRWGASTDVAALLDMNALGENFKDFDPKLELMLYFEFNEDGTFNLFFDDMDKDTLIDKWYDDFFAYARQATAKEAQKQGMSYKDFEAQYEKEYGIAFEEYFRTQIESLLKIDSIVSGIETSGKYKVDGNRFYAAESSLNFDDEIYSVIKISGKKLTFVSTTVPGYDPKKEIIKYPLTFKKSV